MALITSYYRRLVGRTIEGQKKRPQISSIAASPSKESHLPYHSAGKRCCIWISTPSSHNPIISNQLNFLSLLKRRSRYPASTQIIRSILLFGGSSRECELKKPWHDPNFMKDDPPERVEAWLLSLLNSVSKKIYANNRSIDSSLTASYSPNNPTVSFDHEFSIDSTAYLCVLKAYSSSKNHSGAPQKAEYWLNNAIRHHDAAVALFESTYRATSYNSQSIPSKQQATAAAIVQSLQPTVECYNAVIESWANSNEHISVVRSRTWLSKLEDNSNPLQPNASSYDLYLHSLSRGIGKNSKLYLERAEEAESILQYRLSKDAPATIRPTTESFNYVLRAYTRCRKEKSIAGKVMALVREMETIQKEAVLSEVKGGNNHEDRDDWKMNVSPNTKTYTMAMDSWIIKAGIKAEMWRSEQLARNNLLKQKGISNETYNSSTDSRDDGTKEMEFAKSILAYIHALQQVGQADVRASVVGYNTLLSGYARMANELRPDIPLIAEQLLNQMIDTSEDSSTYPDVLSFNALIKAWGKTKRKNSAARCEYWLRKMSNECGDKQKTPIAQPDVKTYNLVMEAWLQMDDPDAARVQDLLLEMKASNAVSPDSESYSKVIRAWLKDELKNQRFGVPGSSVEKAWAWLDELMALEEQGSVGPAPDLFTSIIKTAARSEGRGENLLAVAQAAFWAKRNQSRFNVDSVDFVFLLEVGMKVLAGQERDQFMFNLLRQCARDGFVSKRFVQEAVSGPKQDERPEEERERIRQILFGEELAFLPSSWSRNVHEDARPSAITTKSTSVNENH